MTHRSLIFFLALATMLTAGAQTRKVQNRPYTDLRPFHLGVQVGLHLQDMELTNVGEQTVMLANGASTLITAEQDRWDPGLNVGVMAEFRLSDQFQFRVAPTLYFGSRHITFHNLRETAPDGNPLEQYQELKTVYFSTSANLIFSAPRVNNYRPYLLVGLTPAVNLRTKANDYLRLKPLDLYAEVGFGTNLYLPYFKLRPELKFMFSLINTLDKGHADRLKDKNMLPYTLSVKDTRTKIIALTFYFE